MTSNNIYFIDSRVDEAQTLIAALPEGSTWHVLDAHQDGIEQMASILANYSGLDSIQIISHGSSEKLYLGSTALDNSNLNAYQHLLQGIGSSLKETGDLLLYGCNVAETSAGQHFIQALANYTGADIAASNNQTGFGGDWILEIATGGIEVQPLAVPEAQITLANKAPKLNLGTAFGDYGFVSTNVGSSNNAAEDVQVLGNGKILVAGYAFNSRNSYDFSLTRYNADGSLDASFDGDGMVMTSIGTWDMAHSLVVQGDGKIVVAGEGQDDFAVARYNSNGSLDTSFSGDGKVTTDFGSLGESANSVALQGDGKILVAGEAYIAGTDDFALARYNIDGSLDTTFGGDGKVTTDFGSSNDLAEFVEVQTNGKILVAGVTGPAGQRDIALARYNADGSLDTSFDGDGKLITTFNDFPGYGKNIATQTDGKILIAGSDNGNFALVRYHSDGSLDTSFSGDGKVTTDFGSDDRAYSISVQTDGKIVIAGETDKGSIGDDPEYDLALARYNPDGSLDTSFSGDGKLTTEQGAASDYGQDIAIQSDGKILVVGYAHSGVTGEDFAVARYNSDGSLDTGFSGDGKLATDFFTRDYAYSVCTQTDGKILVAGEADSDGSFAIARYNTDGSLDASFSGDGKVITDFSGYEEDIGLDIAVQSDAKILVAGLSADNFALARYNSDGSLDTGFSGDGKVITDFGGSDSGCSMALLADGKILVAGGSNGNFALARYKSNGSLDLSFDGDGKLTTDLGGVDQGYSIALQPDGKILVGGVSNYAFAMVRYNADGSLDTTFDGDGKLTTNIGGSNDFGYSIALQSDGKILAAVGAGRSSGVIARFNADGSPDSTFDGDGTRYIRLGFGEFNSSAFNAVAVTPDGGILLAGYQTNGANIDFALARLNSEGLSIPGNQSVLGHTSLNFGVPQEMFTDPDGDILTYDSDLSSGEELPAWLNFDSTSLTFTGKPSNLDIGVLNVRITATDPGGLSVSHNFSLTVSPNSYVVGTTGNDKLYGTGQGDSIIGREGEDTLDGGAGNDTMQGGAGNDVFIINAEGDIVIEFSGQGTDLIKSSVTHSLVDTDGTGTNGGNVEKLTLIGTNVINGTGNSLANTLTGNSTANILTGNDSNDTLVGGGGADKLLGGKGNDLLRGGLGNDTLAGGEGNDLFRFDSTLAKGVDKITDFNGKVGTTDTIFDRIQLENTIFKAFAYTGALHASEFRENTTGNAQDADDHIIYNTSTGQLYYDANGNAAGGKYLVANLWDSTTTHPTGAEISAMDFVVV